MKEEDFDQLVASIRQAGAIRGRDETESGHAIRAGRCQGDPTAPRQVSVGIRPLDRCECFHPPELGAGAKGPGGSSAALLRVAAKDPEAVAKALET